MPDNDFKIIRLTKSKVRKKLNPMPQCFFRLDHLGCLSAVVKIMTWRIYGSRNIESQLWSFKSEKNSKSKISKTEF